MTRIVDDLLLLSRADSRVAVLDFQIVDLSDLVIESCERLRPYAEAGRLNLVVENVEPVEVNGDGLRLGQMFRNVLENAIKYTPEGGEIRVQLMRNDADQCQITVADTGIGIPVADLPRVFDRFYRVDKARSRERGGSGLGLSIVKWVVEAHAGAISIESKAGQGALVKIFLPLLTARRDSSVMEMSEGYNGRSWLAQD
jgi:signal transduction histidine kinase